MGALLLASCGGDGDEECGDPGAWSTESLDAPDYDPGKAHLTFADDGTLHAVYGWHYFDEDFGQEYGGISWLRRSSDAWFAERVDANYDPDGGDVAFALAGDRLHVGWTEYGNLRYREWRGDTWTGPVVDLAASFDPDGVDSAEMAIGPDGALALVYTVDSRVRLAWIEDGAIAGEPVTVLEEDLGCEAWYAAFDAGGALNVAASCWTAEESLTLHWITVQPSGSVSTEALWSTAIDQSRYDRLAAIFADGGAHLLWVDSSGEGLLHAQRIGGTWTEPVLVAPSATRSRYAIVTVGDDEIIVAYQVEGNEPALTVEFLSSRDGEPLAPACDRLPDLELPIEGWWPALALDARTGTLVTLYNTAHTMWPDTEFGVASLPL